MSIKILKGYSMDKIMGGQVLDYETKETYRRGH